MAATKTRMTKAQYRTAFLRMMVRFNRLYTLWVRSLGAQEEAIRWSNGITSLQAAFFLQGNRS